MTALKPPEQPAILRVRPHLHDLPLRVGTRASPLALIQTRIFLAHLAHHTPRRADEGNACGGAGVGEFGILRQEAVAGVDRARASLLRRRDDRLDAKIALRGGWRAD